MLTRAEKYLLEVLAALHEEKEAAKNNKQFEVVLMKYVVSEKDKILLEKSKNLKDLLEDFKNFMRLYERDEEEQLMCELGKNSLDFVIGEFKDIVDYLE